MKLNSPLKYQTPYPLLSELIGFLKKCSRQQDIHLQRPLLKEDITTNVPQRRRRHPLGSVHRHSFLTKYKNDLSCSDI